MLRKTLKVALAVSLLIFFALNLAPVSQGQEHNLYLVQPTVKTYQGIGIVNQRKLDITLSLDTQRKQVTMYVVEAHSAHGQAYRGIFSYDANGVLTCQFNFDNGLILVSGLPIGGNFQANIFTENTVNQFTFIQK